MTESGSSSTELTRRLIARGGTQVGASAIHAEIRHAVLERTYQQLVRSIGHTGAAAVFSRVRKQIQMTHPILQGIKMDDAATPVFSRMGVDDSADAGPLAAALEAWLEGVLELLAQMVGIDVVARLVGESAPGDTPETQGVK